VRNRSASNQACATLSTAKRGIPGAAAKVRVAAASLLLLAVSLCIPSASAYQKKKDDKSTAGDARKAKPEKTAYDYYLPSADGKNLPLTNFKGKYLLIVNLGRKSSYNAQLAALEKDYETYKDKGLVVIGVPSNDFGSAEPGTDAEIQKAYADAKVTFPVMAVSKLTGDDTIPFYLYLTKGKDVPPGGPVHWNYTKFFVDKDGKVIARLAPDVAPDSDEMISTIGQILDGRYKPKKADKDKPGGDDDDDE
jgi:glutathione peroxidase